MKEFEAYSTRPATLQAGGGGFKRSRAFRRAWEQGARSLLDDLVFCHAPTMAPRWPKLGPGWPKMAPRWPKTAPRWPQEPPRRPQDGPKWPQDGSKMAPRAPKETPRRCRNEPLESSWEALGVSWAPLGAIFKPSRFPSKAYRPHVEKMRPLRRKMHFSGSPGGSQDGPKTTKKGLQDGSI